MHCKLDDFALVTALGGGHTKATGTAVTTPLRKVTWDGNYSGKVTSTIGSTIQYSQSVKGTEVV